MAGLDSRELGEDTLALVRRTLGRNPGPSAGRNRTTASVSDSAGEYRRRPYANDPERVQALIPVGYCQEPRQRGS